MGGGDVHCSCRMRRCCLARHRELPPHVPAANVLSAGLPGLVSAAAPQLYAAHREPVIMGGKVLGAVLYSRFDWLGTPLAPLLTRALLLANGGPGCRCTPWWVGGWVGGWVADASCMLSTAPACARACRHGLASAFAFCVPVPCHHGCPLRTMHHRLQALVQSGTVFMLSLSVRHSLRFRGQLFCQLVGLFSCCRRSRCALGRSSQGMARAVGCLRLAGTRLLCCHLTQTCPLVVAGGTPQGPIPAAAAGDATAGDAAAVGRRLSAATGSALLAGQAAPHGMRSARCEGAATACSSGTATRFRRHVQQRRRRAAAQLGGASVPLRSTGRAHGSNNAGRLTITAELEKS